MAEKRGPKPKTAPAARRPPAPPSGWEPPESLTGEAEAAWRHVVALLDADGNLGRTDPTLVECYAVNVAILRMAREELQYGLTTLNGAGVPVAHPALAAVNSASMRIKAIISDLGLCPATSKYAADQGGESTTRAEDKWGGLVG